MSNQPTTTENRVYGVFGVRKQPHSPPGEFYSDIAFIERHLDGIWGWHQGNIKVIAGGSHGVEMITEEWALRNHVEFERVKPALSEEHIDPFGMRNDKIIAKSDELLIFWDSQDPQIGRVIRVAVQAQKKITIIPIAYK